MPYGNKKPELLIPLNNWKSISDQTEVLQNGDAFYFGLQSNFSMRARAGNFSKEDLPKLIKKIHDFGKKIFLCTNIIMYDEELEDLEITLNYAKNCEIDAVICHDLAAISFTRDNSIPFHVSTQANISNLRSARFYESLGAERLILARELSIEQIHYITERINTPIETFVHGAMCTAISGRCYLSAELMNFDQNFSANRGKCVQPCRRYYTLTGEENEKLNFEPQSGMFFNAKDLCMIGHIDDLVKANISAFKIEGRMRDPFYISEISACYREALDSYFDGNYTQEGIDKWLERLGKVFNRGFHTGFYFNRPDPHHIERTIRGNVSRYKKKLIGKVIKSYRKASAVEMELYTGVIQVGDEVIFENKTDFYHKQQVTSLQLENENISKTPITSPDTRVIVGLSVTTNVPINADVYLFYKMNENEL